ncbi:DUF2712 domain-containing protein [Miniphocaeibacter massiliensis]|uniref:DUF2712 domain-containing protein n=1 Tax=Miniphocaeibacter massiliensis TaxID=2041841 RepID=UPI000C1C0980|nr:DUF2712 domain-containing protein [Miniphocaeibacter massiliensis]
MKRKLIALSLSMVTVLTMGTTSLAKNNSDSNLPGQIIRDLPTAFVTMKGTAQTKTRAKEDKSGHYINNTSGMVLRVSSHASSGQNTTGGGDSTKVSTGKWRISNYVKERGYSKCYLKINTYNFGVRGMLSGKWSPDSAGSYPYAK